MIALVILVPVTISRGSAASRAALHTPLLCMQLKAARQRLGEERFSRSKYPLAAQLLSGTIQGGPYDDFLTTLCYDHILSKPPSRM